MKKYSLILLFALLNCNPNRNHETSKTVSSDCNDEWIFESSHVIEKQVNDSITQEIIDGKVWFEIISPKDNGDGITKAHIKNYRMNGSLLSEGEAKYYEHPVADYKKFGIWKYYDCNEKLIDTKN
jgi:hypothetical protein